MIDKKSRYRDTPTSSQVDESGERVELLELRQIPATTGVYRHRAEEGERLDHLAHKYLRDPQRFWRICDAADELDPFDVLHPGREVVIPPNK